MTPPDQSPDTLFSPTVLVRGLALARGGRTLFAGIDFSLGPADIRFLRGPNGAGKTSLLLALAGILRPDAGTIRFGETARSEAPAPGMHLLLPRAGNKPRLSLAENLAFWGALYGPMAVAPEDALERVGLGGLGPIQAAHLSTGQLRRLSLARLLVSRRPIWLLDEPTSALDTEGEALVGTMITEHCAAGGMAVVATHHDIAARTAGTVETTVLGAAP